MKHLKEDNGKISSIRIVFFFGTIWNIAIVTYMVITKAASPTEALAFFSGIEAVLGGLKVAQKGSEAK